LGEGGEPVTYPDQRYLGDTGEVTASLRRVASEPDLVYQSGTTVHYLATGSSTGGLFGLYRWTMGERPGGPDPHFHKTIAESFFILDGSVRIYTGEEWVDTRPGDFVHVPPGGVHAFRNESGPAAMLIHFAPGAPREDYFEGLAEFARSGQPGDEQMAEFLRQHDQYRPGA
jgi:mannose-6-phosphate isomerase-like protein (cupin superfamily)